MSERGLFDDEEEEDEHGADASLKSPGRPGRGGVLNGSTHSAHSQRDHGDGRKPWTPGGGNPGWNDVTSMTPAVSSSKAWAGTK
jgi:hypothetical protein